MKEILNYLFSSKTLTRDDARTVLTNIAGGKYNDSEIASFLTVYLMRSITVDELSGFRDALLGLCIPVEFPGYTTIDVCGTGGDEKNTFNISTLTAFVLAGAGYKVTKHGNYSVSSSCGSSNILEYYGYSFTNDRGRLQKQLDCAGICFLHAPLFNPAMKNVAPVRKSLKMKTFFNMLGPMVNPSFPANQVIGVFNLEVARLYHYIYQLSEKNYAIIYSIDGYDEISLTGKYKVFTRQSEMLLSPFDIGLPENLPADLFGGTSVEQAARIFLEILSGKGSKKQYNTVAINAAYGIRCFKPEQTIEECFNEAMESLKSGAALRAFHELLNSAK